MPENVNIGFIGCGGNARGHMNSLNGLDGTQVVAVCDLDEERAKQAAELTGGEAYTDYAKMLEREDLNAAYLSIPVHAHGEPELAVVERGLPFLVEKPVARDMATAQKVLAAVEAKNLITCVGYQLRYLGGTAAAKELLEGQTVALVVGQYWSGTGRGDAGAWIRQYAKSGGQILEQATHALDMIRWLCGDVVEVTARSASRELKEIDCPDINVATLAFESGAVGCVTTTWAFDPKDWSNANIVYITYADKLIRWNGGRSITLSGGGADPQEITGEDRGVDAVFVDAVRTGDSSAIVTPYSDAIKSLELSLAILESAETGQAVKLGV